MTDPARSRFPAARLDALIEEAIVDAYTPDEQAVGFHATIEQHLALPFETVVLGANVTVKRIDVTVKGQIVAVCYRGCERQTIPILDLPLPDPPPADWEDGTEWLSSLVGLRGDIAGGDERPLYGAWLLRVQYGEVDDESLEPAQPNGLGRPSPSIESFIDIMGVDCDLVAAAAEGGARTAAANLLGFTTQAAGRTEVATTSGSRLATS